MLDPENIKFKFKVSRGPLTLVREIGIFLKKKIISVHTAVEAFSKYRDGNDLAGMGER